MYHMHTDKMADAKVNVDPGKTLYYSCEDLQSLVKTEIEQDKYAGENSTCTYTSEDIVDSDSEAQKGLRSSAKLFERDDSPLNSGDEGAQSPVGETIGRPLVHVDTLAPLPNTEVRSDKYQIAIVITPQPSVISSVLCSTVRVTSFCLASSETAWVIDGQDFSEIKLTHIDKEWPLKKFYLHTLVQTICLAPDGDSVLFTCPNERCVRKCKADGKVETVIETSPLIPNGISLDENSDIVVSLTNHKVQDIQEKSRGNDPPRGLLRRYTESGKILQEIETHSDKRLFNFPFKVKVNQETGDIAVTDINDSIKGEVIVLDKKGNPKFFYSGQNSRIFIPFDIAFDKLSNIMISNCASGTIHLLDCKGTFLGRIYKVSVARRVLEFVKIVMPLFRFPTDEKPSVPLEMACDKHFGLWVGCTDGRMRKIKYCNELDQV